MMVRLACEAICLSRVMTALHKSFVRAIIQILTISSCDIIMGPPLQLACTVEGPLFRHKIVIFSSDVATCRVRIR